jgi:superfamily I DNA and/or RNA helicase
VTLLRQRRGVKEIFAYLSEVFYQGMLEHGVEAAEPLEIPPSGDALDSLLTPERPLAWIDVEGSQEWMKVVRGAYTSCSAYNKAEAALAVALYKRLHDAGLAGKTAIITTFRAQALLVSKAAELLRLGKPSVAYTKADEALPLGEIEDLLDLRTASTVDSYQGREKEIVIYSIAAK